MALYIPLGRCDSSDVEPGTAGIVGVVASEACCCCDCEAPSRLADGRPPVDDRNSKGSSCCSLES